MIRSKGYSRPYCVIQVQFKWAGMRNSARVLRWNSKNLWTFTPLFFIRVNFIRIWKLESVEYLRMFWEYPEAQIWISIEILLWTYTKLLCLLFALDFYAKTFLNTAFTIELGYLYVYPRKQKFILWMYQEYFRLRFANNVIILSLDEKIHNCYKKRE